MAADGRTRHRLAVANNNRRLRYRSVARNSQWLATRAVAISLRRLIALGFARTTTG